MNQAKNSDEEQRVSKRKEENKKEQVRGVRKKS